MIAPTYRGHPVARVEYDRRHDTYTLIGRDDEFVAELKSHEYKSLPALRGLPHGRHRRARQKIHRGPVGAPYITIPTGTFVYTCGGTWVTWDPPERKPIEDAGIRAGELTGYRSWRLSDDRLFSVYQHHVEWTPSERMSGDVRNEYGVHAFKELTLAQEYASHYMTGDFWYRVSMDSDGNLVIQDAPPPVFVFGTIKLWGEVIEHERGYRAEFAEIASLEHIVGLPHCEGADALRRVRARYRV